MPSPYPAPTSNTSGRTRRRISLRGVERRRARTIPGTKHVATAFRIDPASGALTPHGSTAPLPSRPVHCSVDRSGEYLLTAYNYPSSITVQRIKPDGTLGDPVAPREKPDVGIFAHQVLTTPGNRTASW
jgi:3-carboxymuconate cyclase